MSAGFNTGDFLSISTSLAIGGVGYGYLTHTALTLPVVGTGVALSIATKTCAHIIDSEIFNRFLSVKSQFNFVIKQAKILASNIAGAALTLFIAVKCGAVAATLFNLPTVLIVGTTLAIVPQIVENLTNTVLYLAKGPRLLK